MNVLYFSQSVTFPRPKVASLSPFWDFQDGSTSQECSTCQFRFRQGSKTLLHLGNLIAFTSYLLRPYLSLFSSICRFRSSLVGLLLVLMIKLFLRVTPVLFILSWKTFSKLRWSPIKSPRDCWPSSRCVCMYICPIDFPARHLELTIFLHFPTPNFINASLRMVTSSLFQPGDSV